MDCLIPFSKYLIRNCYKTNPKRDLLNKENETAAHILLLVSLYLFIPSEVPVKFKPHLF